MHLMTGDAEFLRIRELQRRVEGAPEQHATDKTAEREESKTQVGGGPADEPPKPDHNSPYPRHHAAHGIDSRLNDQHVLKPIWDKRRGVGLQHMAGRAEIAARRNVCEHLVVAVHEVRGDHVEFCRRPGATSVAVNLWPRTHGSIVVLLQRAVVRFVLNCLG